MPQEDRARQALGQIAGAEAAADQQRGSALPTQPLAFFRMTFTYRSWLYCKITLPSHLAALLLNMNVKNEMSPEMFKTSSEAQAACSIIR